MRQAAVAAIAAVAIAACGAAHASIGKWFKNEVVPTIKGERPLKIDPGKVKITDKGRRILDLDVGKDTLFVDLGVATFKTGALKKDLLRAGAVMAGDTAVIDQVLAEQIQQKLQQAVKENGVKVSKKPPPPPSTEPVATGGRQVVIYNATSAPLRYAINDRYYVLPPESGNAHQSGEFYLQYDAQPGAEIDIKRYYLTGDQYVIWYPEYAHSLTLERLD